MTRGIFLTIVWLVVVVVHADLDLLGRIWKPGNVFERDKIHPRIVGGFPSGPGAYPFAVHAFDGEQGLCSGILVHPDVVITAASCQSVFETTNQVYVGSNDLYGRDFAPQVAIQFVFPHPDFNASTLEHDVLLVQLETPVSSAVATVATTLPSEGQLLFALGFGRLGPLDGTFAMTRHEVDMPAVELADCAQVYGDSLNVDQHICAGIPGMGPCEGDEGGPLLDAVTTELHGIWSFSEGCGAAPAVFTRVAYYDAWIRNFVCNNSRVPPEDCTLDNDDSNDDATSTDDNTDDGDNPIDDDDNNNNDDGGYPTDDDDDYDDDHVYTKTPTPAPTHDVYPTSGKGKGGKKTKKSSKSFKKGKRDKLSKKSGKRSSGKRSSGKKSSGKGSFYGEGSYEDVSSGKGSSGKGSYGKGVTYGKGSSGKGVTYGKGSSGKGASYGKGSSGKGASYGKGSSGKGASYGKGSSGKGSSGKGSAGKGQGDAYERHSSTTYGRSVDVSTYVLQTTRHNRSPNSI